MKVSGGGRQDFRKTRITGALWTFPLLIVIVSSIVPSCVCYMEKPSPFPGKYLKSLAMRGGGERAGDFASLSNGIGEPSCEELRAMWRYHKRQSRRAELTNEIGGNFGPMYYSDFWGVPPVRSSVVSDPLPSYTQVSSFGGKPFKLRGRSGHRGGRRPYAQLRFFGPDSGSKWGKSKGGMEQVREILAKEREVEQQGQEGSADGGKGETSAGGGKAPSKGSFQTLQQMLIEEKLKEQGGEGSGGNGRGRGDEKTPSFGTLLLSPPGGSDGRVANKPPDMMTPFEKLRFGLVQPPEEVEGVDAGRISVSRRSDRRLSGEDGGGDDDEEEENDDIEFHPTYKRGLFYYPIRAARMRKHREETHSLTATTIPPTTAPTTPISSLPKAPISSVFSFWRRQLLPQDPPLSNLMVDSITSCTMVQGLPCSINEDCFCSGNGLFRCSGGGQCQFLTMESTENVGYESRDKIDAVVDEAVDDGGSWHSEPLDSDLLGAWDDSRLLSSGREFGAGWADGIWRSQGLRNYYHTSLRVNCDPLYRRWSKRICSRLHSGAEKEN